MKIALKETDETLYWLALCRESKTYYFEESLMDEAEQIMKILSKILSTIRKKDIN